MKFLTLLGRPAACLPLLMSLAALTTVAYSVSRFGVVRGGDEGAAAHIWQLLMAGQLPVIAYFAVRWVPRCPRPALGVVALQGCAALAAMAPVYLLRL